MDKKSEAIKRMKTWGMYGEVINQFKRDDRINLSEPPFGACFWLTEEQMVRVRNFEKKYNALVYHVIHNFTEFGELENYLFVSNYPEEWLMDNSDIKEDMQLVYVSNLDAPEFSEFGTIGVALTPAGGLKRVW